MDYRYNPNNRPFPSRQGSSGMETAALLLGILSVLTCTCIYLSLPFGALAILLGLLSRGGSLKMGDKATVGVTTGAVGLAVTAIFYAMIFGTVFRAYGGVSNFYDSYVSILTDADYSSTDERYQALYDDLEKHLIRSDSGNTYTDTEETSESKTQSSAPKLQP